MIDLDLNPAQRRQQYRDLLDGKTGEELMWPYPSDGVTAAELDAVRDYQTDTAGIPDCFDCLGGADQLDYLVGISGLLGEWWEGIDRLDGKISDQTTGTRATGTESARGYLQEQIRTWFDTRHQFLLALAHAAGAVKVPQPDYDAGAVQTSGIGALGAYGYHPLH